MSDAETDQFTDCEACGEPVDMLESGVWKSPNDEQWWHEGCYDKMEQVETLQAKLLALRVPEGEFDGLSDHFHNCLDKAQAVLDDAVRTERLMQDQEIGPYSRETAQDGGSDE